MLAIKFKHKGWFYTIISEDMPSVLKPANIEPYDPLRLNEKNIRGGLDGKTNR